MLHEIGRALGKEHSSIRCLVSRHGGIAPAVRRRALHRVYQVLQAKLQFLPHCLKRHAACKSSMERRKSVKEEYETLSQSFIPRLVE